MGKIFIGTSGYYYKDWETVFYPDGLDKNKRLEFYSNYFDILEINYSYYKLPKANYHINFIENSHEKMRFSIKATNIFTHSRKYSSSDIIKFNSALEPFLEKKLLLGILFQFPYSFHFNDQNLNYLLELKNSFYNNNFFIELRNAKWFNNEIIKLLWENNILLCSSDYPDIKDLPKPNPHLTGNYGYIRFHGRNSNKWYKHNKAYERYDYKYNKEELISWIPKIRKITDSAKETYIFFNNHYNANAVKNAIILGSYFVQTNNIEKI